MKRRQTPPVVPSNPVLTSASRTASWRRRWSNLGDWRKEERPRRASLRCSPHSVRRDSALPLRSRLRWPIPYKRLGVRQACRRRWLSNVTRIGAMRVRLWALRRPLATDTRMEVVARHVPPSAHAGTFGPVSTPDWTTKTWVCDRSCDLVLCRRLFGNT